MKQTILVISLLLLSLITTAQAVGTAAPYSNDTVFFLRGDLTLQECPTNSGAINAGASTQLKRYMPFYKVAIVMNGATFAGYIIHFREKNVRHPHVLPWEKISNEAWNELYVYTLTSPNNVHMGSLLNGRHNFPGVKNNKYFFLPAANVSLTDTALSHVSRVTFTNLNIQSLPAKVRFGSNKTLHYPDDNNTYHRRYDITGGINVGAAFGPRFSLDKGHGNNFLSVLAGFSVGSVSIDSSTTDNKCGTTKIALGLTPYGGITYEYKNFQFGAFVGFDFIPGEIGRNWNYRNQPWLGIGIGYSIFGKVNTPAGQTAP